MGEPGRNARILAGAHTLAADPVEKPYLKFLIMASTGCKHYNQAFWGVS